MEIVIICQALSKCDVTKALSKCDATKWQSDVDDLVPRERGAHLCCPCGKWKPQAGQASNVMYARAVTHWRDCQGCKPPKMQPSARKEAQREAARSNKQPEQSNAARDAFVKWRRNLAQDVERDACDPTLDVTCPFKGRDVMDWITFASSVAPNGTCHKCAATHAR